MREGGVRVKETRRFLPKQSFLSAENLNRRRGILGQIGQTASMSNETSTDLKRHTIDQSVISSPAYLFTDQQSQIGRDLSHLASQILQEGIGEI